MAGFNLGDIIVTLKAKTEDLERGLGEVRRMADQTKELGGKMQASLANAADGSKKFALGVAAAGAAVIGLGVAGVKSASDFEQSRIAFETMLGSADKARSLMNDIAKFAKETPFELPEVVAGSKQLLAFGFAQEQILPTMRKLGDVASGLGVPVGQLTNVFGQVRVAGRLMGQDLLQFTNAGVPMIEALATTMKKPQSEIKKLVEEGKIGFPEVETAMNHLTGEGSKFGGMMEKQSKSFSGVISNIKDGFGQFLRTMVGITNAGDIVQGGLFDKLKKGAEMVMPIVQRLPEIIEKGFNKLKPAIVPIIGLILGGLVPAFYALATSIWTSMAPLIPWFAAGAAVGAVVQLIVKHIGGWGVVMEKVKPIIISLKGFLDGLISTMQKVWTAIKPVAEFIGGQLMAAFQTLWKAIEDNLMPALVKLWPIIKIIGAALLVWFAGPIVVQILAVVAMVWLFINALKVIVNVGSWVVQTVAAMISWLVGAISTAWNAIVSAATTAWNFIWNNVIKPVLDVIMAYIHIVAAVYGYIWQWIVALATIAWNYLWDSVISPVLNAIVAAAQWLGGIIAGVWNWIANAAAAVWRPIGNMVQEVWNRIASIWGNAVGWLNGIWNSIRNGFSNVWNSLGGIVSGVFGGIKSTVVSAINWIIDKINGAINAINNVASKVPGAPRVGNIPRLAKGTSNFQGGAAITGEEGPELAIYPKGAQVIPHNFTASLLSNLMSVSDMMRTFLSGDATAFLTSNQLSTAQMAGGGGQRVSNTNIYGDINVGDKGDADYLLQRIDRNSQLEEMGVTPLNA